MTTRISGKKKTPSLPRHFAGFICGGHRHRASSRGADADADPLGAVLVLTETSLTSQYRITDDDACLTAAWREQM